MFTLYGYPKTRSTRVLWALEEVQAKVDFVLTSPGVEAKSDAYLALNPTGKIPCFVHDDLVLSESAAICIYIGDQFPEYHLTPAPGSADRATHDSWCYFAMTEMEQALWTMAKHTFALPKEYRIPKMRETAEYEFQRALKVFHKKLGEKEFLIGSHFTIADLLVTNILNWRHNGKVERPLKYENVEAYFERHRSRPALQRVADKEANMLD